MKKRILSLLIAFIMCSTTFTPAFASIRLERPEIHTVKRTSSSIFIDWSNVKHADYYKIYYSYESDGEYKYFATTDASSYKDTDLEPGTRYYYKVRAFSDDTNYSRSYLSKWRSGKLKSASHVSSSVPVSQTVYITRTGNKYHNYGCQYLRQSCIKTTLSSAKNNNYTPCSRCFN